MMIKKFIIIFILMFICLANLGRSLVKQTQKFPECFYTYTNNNNNNNNKKSN
jgi:predicted PurR-regulated permease PerM